MGYILGILITGGLEFPSSRFFLNYYLFLYALNYYYKNQYYSGVNLGVSLLVYTVYFVLSAGKICLPFVFADAQAPIFYYLY